MKLPLCLVILTYTSYLSSASFNAPYNLVRLMHEKGTANIKFLCCALWSKKYGKTNLLKLVFVLFFKSTLSIYASTKTVCVWKWLRNTELQCGKTIAFELCIWNVLDCIWNVL